MPSPWLLKNFELGANEWLLDKWTLGPLRIFNFLCILGFVYGFRDFFSKLIEQLYFLRYVGRQTLFLMAFHVCVSLFFIGLAQEHELDNFYLTLFLITQLVLLIVFAYILEVAKSRLQTVRHLDFVSTSQLRNKN